MQITECRKTLPEKKNRDLSKVIKREGPIEKKGGYWLGGLGGSLEGIS